MPSVVAARPRARARIVGLLAVVIGLAGCDNGAGLTEGVGFGDYQRYMRERDASGGAQSAGAYAIPPENNRTVQSNAPAAAAAPASASNPYDAYASTPSAPASLPPVQAAAPAAAPVPTTSLAAQSGSAAAPAASGDIAERPSGVQNEQDYLQVLARGAGAADPASAAPAEVVRVDSVPTAGNSSGPNVVAYALATSHPVGESRYNRINPLRWQTWERNCLAYAGQDAAQEAFLANGGPERDRGNLDPDGDGFACWWDPSAYRSVARGG